MDRDGSTLRYQGVWICHLGYDPDSMLVSQTPSLQDRIGACLHAGKTITAMANIASFDRIFDFNVIGLTQAHIIGVWQNVQMHWQSIIEDAKAHETAYMSRGIGISQLNKIRACLSFCMHHVLAKLDVLCFAESLTPIDLYHIFESMTHRWQSELSLHCDHHWILPSKASWLEISYKTLNKFIDHHINQTHIPGMMEHLDMLISYRGDAQAMNQAADTCHQALLSWYDCRQTQCQHLLDVHATYRQSGVVWEIDYIFSQKIDTLKQSFNRVKGQYQDQWLVIQREIAITIEQWYQKPNHEAITQALHGLLIQSQSMMLIREGPWLAVKDHDKWIQHPKQWQDFINKIDQHFVTSNAMMMQAQAIQDAFDSRQYASIVNQPYGDISKLSQCLASWQYYRQRWSEDGFNKMITPLGIFVKRCGLSQSKRKKIDTLLKKIFLSYALEVNTDDWHDACSGLTLIEHLALHIQQPSDIPTDGLAQAFLDDVFATIDCSDKWLSRVWTRTRMVIDTLIKRKEHLLLTPYLLKVYHARGNQQVHQQAIDDACEAVLRTFNAETKRIEEFKSHYHTYFEPQLASARAFDFNQAYNQLEYAANQLMGRYQLWLANEASSQALIKQWQQGRFQTKQLHHLLALFKQSAQLGLFAQDQAIDALPSSPKYLDSDIQLWQLLMPSWAKGHHDEHLKHLASCEQDNQCVQDIFSQLRVLASNETFIKTMRSITDQFDHMHLTDQRLIQGIIEQWAQIGDATKLCINHKQQCKPTEHSRTTSWRDDLKSASSLQTRARLLSGDGCAQFEHLFDED